MNEAILVKSKERLDFGRQCVNCGRETKRVFSVDTATPRIVSWISLVVPYSIIFNYFAFARKGMVHMPFCSRCYWEYFSPAKGVMVAGIGALTMIGLFLYFMSIEWYVAALACVVIAFAGLIAMLRADRHRSRVAMPFQVWRQSGEFHYLFKSGYHHNLLSRSRKRPGGG